VSPGDRIRVEITKWGGRPHWEYDGLRLGADAWGDWLGFPVGTRYQRPGMDFVSDFASVVLVPADGSALLAAFNDEHAKAAVYVDMATVPSWDGTVLRATDLDLDVVRTQDGRVYLDDEDEFLDHQARYGYPADVVALAERTAAAVLVAVREGRAPYDGTAAAWHERLAGLS
jgi:hypothetical protein